MIYIIETQCSKCGAPGTLYMVSKEDFDMMTGPVRHQRFFEVTDQEVEDLFPQIHDLISDGASFVVRLRYYTCAYCHSSC